jgi:2-C-methyl-D-erythritol 2,4-cyclodiphosphate synthase
VIAEILMISENQVSIKATTSEKMGFVGRQEGIAAYATVLLMTVE